MGVRGLTALLQKEGLLPSSKTGSSTLTTSLWRNSAIISTQVGQHIVPIPDRSTLHIDGNGLAFFLYQVAYARLVKQVTGKASPSLEMIRSLTPSQVMSLIPTFLPLHLLETVTKEFVEALRKHHMQILVYWDGPGRRFKAVTDKKRLERRILEWHTLQQYCLNGALPSADVAEWESTFPYDSLFVSQVRYTLRSFQDITIITCTEEADPEMARRAVGHPNHFVVGRDSDFLLMGCPYIPLDTLDAGSASMVTACVLSRHNLAHHFALQDEHNLIEMAILMGNDYIDRDTMQLDFRSKATDEILDHIRDQGPGYRVTSISEDVEEAMRFVRAVYNLEDLSEFPLDEISSEDKEDVFDDDDGGDRPILAPNPRPTMPADLPRSLLVLRPLLDKSVAQAVVRCLQAYIDQAQEASNIMIQQEHVDAFQRMNELKMTGQVTRPDHWKDVTSCYLIERCISYALKSAPDSLLVSISSPANLFNPIQLFSVLQASRSLATSSNVPSSAKSLPETPASQPQAPTSSTRVVLPIDEHEQKILDEIKNNRVTIIHGQTGCGKSSRLPCMILKAPPPDPTLKHVKFFISQPRRIAAKALVERIRSCEPDFRDSIALRMGHGVREYESDKTKAWFVTTGYLVRVLANQPDKFRDHSHLIIDEVHERSVDTDILCLLCRRLLQSNSSIRLILMSATLAAELYQQYFQVERPVIEVGARRFPVQEIYVDELHRMFTLKPKELKAAQAVAAECERMKCQSPPSQHHMENMFSLAAHLAMVVGRPGSAVLIFVPGMNEIIAITDLVEKFYVPGVRFTCIPIHSDIPFEDQMTAFDKPKSDEVRVIVATNSAESSVTLPDVDDVICLGLCKQIEYNQSSHRQILLPCWISRASAIQRQGRTGRLREGRVFRLYTRNTFEKYMGEFEPGEMVRIPLDSVILSLKEMLKEEAKPILLDCLEPPDISTIDRSFQSLYNSNFISEPDDCGDITTLGSFVNALGVDLTLGSLIGYGIQMGVGPEAIEMAAVLSFPKQPWVITSPMIHEASEYNIITSKTYVSRCHFDANTYSEAFAIMNLMWDFEESDNQLKWCRFFCISLPRIRRLVSTRNSLRNRVAEFVGIDSANIRLDAPPRRMPHAKLTILRILHVWLFWDTILEYSPMKKVNATADLFSMSLEGKGLQNAHLEQVLDRKRHEFRLRNENEVTQKGLLALDGQDFDIDDFLRESEQRFLSFAQENDYDLLWMRIDGNLRIYARDRLCQSKGFQSLTNREVQDQDGFESLTLTAVPNNSGPRRGIRERASGKWRFEQGNERKPTATAQPFWVKHIAFKPGKIIFALQNQTKDNAALARSMSLEIWTKNKKNGLPTVCFVCRGQCLPLNQQAMDDMLLGKKMYNTTTTVSANANQILSFPAIRNAPLQYNNRVKKSESNGLLASENVADRGSNESWTQPLFEDAPEGARLLLVLLSGRRRENIIQFSPLQSESETALESESPPVIVKMHRDMKILGRWKRMGTDKAVYVSENSVPASVLPLQQNMQLFCCCANSLEVRGGGLRAEGLTLLPPGRLFLLLSLVTLDLFPLHSTKSLERESIIEEGMKWVNEGGKDNCSPKANDETERDKIIRLGRAVDFHYSCSNLGDELLCYPSKVRSLCEIFDGLNGYESRPWDSLDDNPFTYDNLELLRYQRRLSSPTTQSRMPARSADAKTLTRTSAPSTPNDRSLSESTPQRKSWSFKKQANFSCTDDGASHPHVANGPLTSMNSLTPFQVNVRAEGGNKKSSKKKKEKNRNRKGKSDLSSLSAIIEAESSEAVVADLAQDRAGSPISFPGLPVVETQPTLVATSDSENCAPPIFYIDSKPNSSPVNKDITTPAPKNKKQHGTKPSLLLHLLRKKMFSTDELKLSHSLFLAHQLPSDKAVGEEDLPTTNILALVIQSYCDSMLKHNLTSQVKLCLEQQRDTTYNSSDWSVFETPADENGKVWFYCIFCNSLVPLLPFKGRGKKILPRFMKDGRARPITLKQGLECFPPSVAAQVKAKVVEARVGKKKKLANVLVFQTFDMALRAEAAFWLTRQFDTGKKHWYSQTLDELVGKLMEYAPYQDEVSNIDDQQQIRKASTSQNGGSMLAVSPDVANLVPFTPLRKTKSKPIQTNKEKKNTASNFQQLEQDGGNQWKHIAMAQKEFSSTELKLSHSLFAVHLSSDQAVGEHDFPTTNLLAILVQKYCDTQLERDLAQEDRLRFEQKRVVTLSPSDWLVYATPANDNDKVWYYAEFNNSVVPFLPIEGRGKKNLPRFIRRKHPRPKSMKHAFDCFPPNIAVNKPKTVGAILAKRRDPVNLLVFETLDMALRAEAAFWLERQFATSDKHWYNQTLDQMIATLENYAREIKVTG